MEAAAINRLLMRTAYNLIRFWDRLLKPSTKAATIAVWHNDQILVVRHSYKAGWSLPGGRGKKNEEPRVTASREVREEVGIDLDPSNLILVSASRSGKSLFEYQLSSPPELKIDNREIIEAKFVDPAEITDPDGILYSYLKKASGNAGEK